MPQQPEKAVKTPKPITGQDILNTVKGDPLKLNIDGTVLEVGLYQPLGKKPYVDIKWHPDENQEALSGEAGPKNFKKAIHIVDELLAGVFRALPDREARLASHANGGNAGDIGKSITWPLFLQESPDVQEFSGNVFSNQMAQEFAADIADVVNSVRDRHAETVRGGMQKGVCGARKSRE